MPAARWQGMRRSRLPRDRVRVDLDRPQHLAIVQRYRELGREGMPIRVVATPEQADRDPDVLAGVEMWTHEPTVADLDGFAAEVEANDR